jgi:glycosyltransferase involved in cell wall biosynthesis
MKVLVLTNMYPTSGNPYYGVFVKEQVESLRRQGISLDVFFIDGKESRLNYFGSVSKLLKKLRSTDYDIIHAHHTYCVYPLSIARALTKSRLPCILTLHEGEVHRSWKSIAREAGIVKKFVYLKSLKKMATKNVDLVITVEEKLTDKLGFGGKVEVLPCGVDLDMFRPRARASCRKRLGLAEDKQIVLFPATDRKGSQKGFDIVQAAIKLVSVKDLSLIGGGNIPHEDMPYYMCAADVVAQASMFEASPMVIKEAMACNIPVVSTNVGDVEKVIGDSDGHYMCKRDAQDVAENIEKALRFDGPTKGRDRILSLGLSLDQTSKKIHSIYKEAVSASKEITG